MLYKLSISIPDSIKYSIDNNDNLLFLLFNWIINIIKYNQFLYLVSKTIYLYYLCFISGFDLHELIDQSSNKKITKMRWWKLRMWNSIHWGLSSAANSTHRIQEAISSTGAIKFSKKFQLICPRHGLWIFSFMSSAVAELFIIHEEFNFLSLLIAR